MLLFFPTLKMPMTKWNLHCSCVWIWTFTRGMVHVKSQYCTAMYFCSSV